MTTITLSARYARHLLTSLASVAFVLSANEPAVQVDCPAHGAEHHRPGALREVSPAGRLG